MHIIRWREPLAQEIPTFHTGKCSVSVHVPTQRVIFLSSCPTKFTKLLKPPITELHKKGHISASYIYDLYLQGRTYDLCVCNVIDTFYSIRFPGVYNPSREICIYPVPTFGSIRFYYRLGRHDCHTDP